MDDDERDRLALFRLVQGPPGIVTQLEGNCSLMTYESLKDRRKKIKDLIDDTKCRYLWMLFAGGVLLFLARSVLVLRAL
jgi:hypothetical protein